MGSTTWERPQNAMNTTVYAIRPLKLVDITDKDSADASGDIFFWIKDHLIKPMHCRATPRWHQCNESSTIDVSMVYQTFIVEHDSKKIGPYQACNPNEKAKDPDTAPWICKTWGHISRGSAGFGQEAITGRYTHQQFPGDPTPEVAKKFVPGYWYSTSHETECGNHRANQSVPCTWLKHPGK